MTRDASCHPLPAIAACEHVASVIHRLLFECLNRRHSFRAGNRCRSLDDRWRSDRRRRFGNRRRTCGGRSGSFCHRARLHCATSSAGSRSRAPDSPRMGDRRSCRISDHRTCNCAHRSKNDQSGNSAQDSASSAILCLCFERDQRGCEYRRNDQFLHGGLLGMRPS